MISRWIAFVVLPAAVAVAAHAQAPAPALVLRAPAPDTVLAGPSTFAADVSPSDLPIRQVVFFVDGRPACTARVRPFECSWDAGLRPDGRTIRVVAELSNGKRLFITSRTRAADLDTPIFRAAASAVIVPVQVTDSRGRVVAGLTPDRFRLMEDGVPQQIDGVLQGDAPASILLCLDASSSMLSVLPELKRATAEFLDAVRPQDTVGLAVFNTGFRELASPDLTAAARRASLEGIRPTGSTALFDSMIRAVGQIRTRPSPRAVIVFTDGVDTASRSTAETVRRAFQANDIVLYFVVQGQAPSRDSSGGRLVRLAEETGGSALFDPRMSRLGTQFVKVITDLVNRYVLVYSPQKPFGDDAWRTITVEVTGATTGYRVHSREGYVASRRDGNGQ